jgi:hypothetical protein
VAGDTAAGGPIARSLAAPSPHSCGTPGTAPSITRSAGFAALMRATKSGGGAFRPRRWDPFARNDFGGVGGSRVPPRLGCPLASCVAGD